MVDTACSQPKEMKLWVTGEEPLIDAALAKRTVKKPSLTPGPKELKGNNLATLVLKTNYFKAALVLSFPCGSPSSSSPLLYLSSRRDTGHQAMPAG